MMKVATVSRHAADDRMERMMNIARLIGWGRRGSPGLVLER